MEKVSDSTQATRPLLVNKEVLGQCQGIFCLCVALHYHPITEKCPRRVCSTMVFVLHSFPTIPTFQGGELPEGLDVAD